MAKAAAVSLSWEELLAFSPSAERGGWSEDVAAEVSAVASIHGQECRAELSGSELALRVDLTPNTAEDETQQFVAATLELRITPQYPAEPARVSLSDVLGMDSAREAQLLEDLAAFSEELCREQAPALVATCEHAKDLLTRMNHPDGTCCFCQELLNPSGESSDDSVDTAAPQAATEGTAESGTQSRGCIKAASIAAISSGSLIKLMSCLHCFHSPCLLDWWDWQQQQQQQQGLGVPAVTATPQAPPTSADLPFGVVSQRSSTCSAQQSTQLCPVCRCPLLEEDCARLDALVEQRSSRTGMRPNSEAEDLLSSTAEHLQDLSPRNIQGLQDFQRRFQEALSVQESRGGLIPSAQQQSQAGPHGQGRHEGSHDQADSGHAPFASLAKGLVFVPAISYDIAVEAPKTPEAASEGSSAERIGGAHRQGPVHSGAAHKGPLHTGPRHTGPLHTGVAHTGAAYKGPVHTGVAHKGAANGVGNRDAGASGVLGSAPAGQETGGGRGYDGRRGRGRGGRGNTHGRGWGPGAVTGGHVGHSHSHSHSHSQSHRHSHGESQSQSGSQGRGRHPGPGQQVAGTQQGQGQGQARIRQQGQGQGQARIRQQGQTGRPSSANSAHTTSRANSTNTTGQTLQTALMGGSTLLPAGNSQSPAETSTVAHGKIP